MLSQRQSEVLAIYRGFLSENGVAPSLRDLCELAGVTSRGTMSRHLIAIERAGFITRARYSRSAVVLGHCPCCGGPIPSADQPTNGATHAE